MWDTFLYIALMGVSTFFYLKHYRVLTPPLRTLAINISITFLTTLAAIYLLVILHKRNIHFFHVLIIIQYALYGLMFSQVFTQIRVKRLIWLSILLFSITSVVLSSTIQPWHTYNSYTFTLANILIILLSSYYLWRTFMDAQIEALEHDAMFWVTIGLFFFVLGSFFVQGLMAYLITKSQELALKVYWIREATDLILFGFFLWALHVYLRYLPDKS